MKDLPRVIIKTPVAPRGKFANVLGTKVVVDGVEWDAVIDYRVGAGVNEPMTMTMTFYANVTIEHLPAGQCPTLDADLRRCLVDEGHAGAHVFMLVGAAT